MWCYSMFGICVVRCSGFLFLKKYFGLGVYFIQSKVLLLWVVLVYVMCRLVGIWFRVLVMWLWVVFLAVCWFVWWVFWVLFLVSCILQCWCSWVISFVQGVVWVGFGWLVSLMLLNWCVMKFMVFSSRLVILWLQVIWLLCIVFIKFLVVCSIWNILGNLNSLQLFLSVCIIWNRDFINLGLVGWCFRVSRWLVIFCRLLCDFCMNCSSRGEKVVVIVFFLVLVLCCVVVVWGVLV